MICEEQESEEVVGPSFKNIPRQDVLYKLIFSKLNISDWLNMLKTCKSMNSIMNDFFAVNKYLDMSKDLDSSNSSVFRILTRNATNLRVLNLSGCSWLNDDSLRSVIRNNTSLDELDLSYCFNCSAAIFQILTVNCPNITSLSLRGCNWVDPVSLDYFSNHRNNRKRDQSMENVLLTMGKGLRTNLKEKTKAKYKGKDQLFDTLKRKESSQKRYNKTLKFRSFQKLDLTGCTKLMDENIELLVCVFKNLQVLRIRDLPSIGDIAMKAIAVHSKEINSVDICNCPQITNAGLFTIVKHCSKLKEVVIGKKQFTDDILQFLKQKNINIIHPVVDSNSTRLIEDNFRIAKSLTYASNNPRQSSVYDGVMLGIGQVPPNI